MLLRDDEKWSDVLGEWRLENRGCKASRVVARVRPGIVIEGLIEDGTSTGAGVAGRPARSGRRKKQVAPDIRLEVDAEIVPPMPPARGTLKHRSRIQPGAVTRKPARVERLDAVDVWDRPRELLVPAADHEIDPCRRRMPANRRDSGERHQQVADPLETKQQNPLRHGRLLSATERANDRRRRRE